MVGVKLGCGFDGPVRGTTIIQDYPLWSSEDPVDAKYRCVFLINKGTLMHITYRKYPRCCASYAMLDSCEAYQSPPCPRDDPACAYDCSRYTLATDCVQQASGTFLQNSYGMGLFVDKIRCACV
jgi:hypothetical protein